MSQNANNCKICLRVVAEKPVIPNWQSIDFSWSSFCYWVKTEIPWVIMAASFFFLEWNANPYFYLFKWKSLFKREIIIYRLRMVTAVWAVRNKRFNCGTVLTVIKTYKYIVYVKIFVTVNFWSHKYYMR